MQVRRGRSYAASRRPRRGLLSPSDGPLAGNARTLPRHAAYDAPLAAICCDALLVFNDIFLPRPKVLGLCLPIPRRLSYAPMLCVPDDNDKRPTQNAATSLIVPVAHLPSYRESCSSHPALRLLHVLPHGDAPSSFLFCRVVKKIHIIVPLSEPGQNVALSPPDQAALIVCLSKECDSFLQTLRLQTENTHTSLALCTCAAGHSNYLVLQAIIAAHFSPYSLPSHMTRKGIGRPSQDLQTDQYYCSLQFRLNAPSPQPARQLQTVARVLEGAAGADPVPLATGFQGNSSNSNSNRDTRATDRLCGVPGLGEAAVVGVGAGVVSGVAVGSAGIAIPVALAGAGVGYAFGAGYVPLQCNSNSLRNPPKDRSCGLF